MILRGRYGDTSGRPYIGAHLLIPHAGVDGIISFLVDTGADCTCLMPSDAAKLGIDYTKLTVTDEALGFGGISVDYILPAILTLADNGDVAHAWKIELRIAPQKPESMTMPSVIGRDVLKHCCLTFDPTNDVLNIEIRHSHAQSRID